MRKWYQWTIKKITVGFELDNMWWNLDNMSDNNFERGSSVKRWDTDNKTIMTDMINMTDINLYKTSTVQYTIFCNEITVQHFILVSYNNQIHRWLPNKIIVGKLNLHLHMMASQNIQ